MIGDEENLFQMIVVGGNRRQQGRVNDRRRFHWQSRIFLSRIRLAVIRTDEKRCSCQCVLVRGRRWNLFINLIIGRCCGHCARGCCWPEEFVVCLKISSWRDRRTFFFGLFHFQVEEKSSTKQNQRQTTTRQRQINDRRQRISPGILSIIRQITNQIFAEADSKAYRSNAFIFQRTINWKQKSMTKMRWNIDCKRTWLLFIVQYGNVFGFQENWRLTSYSFGRERLQWAHRTTNKDLDVFDRRSLG